MPFEEMGGGVCFMGMLCRYTTAVNILTARQACFLILARIPTALNFIIGVINHVCTYFDAKKAA